MLTVIIPSLNVSTVLPDLLARLTESNIVISDGGSDDDTLVIAAASGARIAFGAKGRGRQLARGAKWAGAVCGNQDWYLFLHADGRLAENWRSAVHNHMEEHFEKAGYFCFKMDCKDVRARVIEFFVGIRCKFWHLPYGDQGLLIRKDLYESIGGYPQSNLFEDVDIVKRLRGKLRALDAKIYTDVSKYKEHGFFRRAFKNLGVYRLYKKGNDQETLIRAYNS
ncbi:MAG: glycosyltransferase [Robiginitomaculum sp.]